MIQAKNFQQHLLKIADFTAEKKLALALSGGGDSMALAALLNEFCQKNGIALHLLTVDHGLRSESAAEAKQVGEWVKAWEGCIHKILKWKGEKPLARIQEAAREARYELMIAYCKRHKIDFLFLAHHADDQIETFLFRLAKGSGVDGLAGMPVKQERDGITLVRPCLDYTHEDMLAFCQMSRVSWVEDPSNQSEKYARTRLRNSRKILSTEGLTGERISMLSKRIERMREALNHITDQSWQDALIVAEKNRLELDLKLFRSCPEEIGLRLLQRALTQVGGARKYPASLQKLEEIVSQIRLEKFKAATLANCIIRLKKSRNRIEIIPE